MNKKPQQKKIELEKDTDGVDPLEDEIDANQIEKDTSSIEQDSDKVDEDMVSAEQDTDTVDEDTGSAEEGVPPSYEELVSEITAVKDQLLRSLAEGENIRRRSEREKADMSKYAITNFAREIISVADNLARALSSVNEDSRKGNEELESLYVGIEMTEKELISKFEQFNITVIDSIGTKFDHNVHQAMFEIDDSDQPAGVVVQEVQKGYTLHDRLLRPAMVGVSKGGPEPTNDDDELQITEKTQENNVNNGSSAYEKQSEAVNKVAEGKNTKFDKEL